MAAKLQFFLKKEIKNKAIFTCFLIVNILVNM
jgi:hypothetical protein